MLYILFITKLALWSCLYIVSLFSNSPFYWYTWTCTITTLPSTLIWSIWEQTAMQHLQRIPIKWHWLYVSRQWLCECLGTPKAIQFESFKITLVAKILLMDGWRAYVAIRQAIYPCSLLCTVCILWSSILSKNNCVSGSDKY